MPEFLIHIPIFKYKFTMLSVYINFFSLLLICFSQKIMSSEPILTILHFNDVYDIQ